MRGAAEERNDFLNPNPKKLTLFTFLAKGVASARKRDVLAVGSPVLSCMHKEGKGER